MVTNWKELSKTIGSLRDDGLEIGGLNYTERAIDEILGDEWVKTAVDHIISFKPGQELAMNCLSFIHSAKATRYAYDIYKSSGGERAARAVWLIKHLANIIAIEWVEEFLNDDNVIVWGLGVLDQLLWTDRLSYSSQVEALLNRAEKNSNGQLKENIDFIKKYVDERNDC